MYLSPEALAGVSANPDLGTLALRQLDAQLIALKRQVTALTSDPAPATTQGMRHPDLWPHDRAPLILVGHPHPLALGAVSPRPRALSPGRSNPRPLHKDKIIPEYNSSPPLPAFCTPTSED